MNILLTCAGRRNYMVDYFRAALAGRGGKVFAANSDPVAAALAAADRGFLVPELYAPEYIDALIQICGEYDIGALVPLFDLELPVLANARELLASKGIQAVVSSPAVISVCNDKWETQHFLQTNGFQAPRTFSSLDSAREALVSGILEFPLIIKPRWGMGSIGVVEVETEQELPILYARAQRTVQRSYLATANAKAPQEALLIQEKMPGQEYGLDVVNDLKGNYVTTFVKRKLAMRAGETDAAITVNDPVLSKFGERISERLGHIGNLDVDVFVNERGPWILEMNPRFGGGYPFSHLAGADLPSAIVAWLFGEIPVPSCFKITAGVLGLKGIMPLRAHKQAVDKKIKGLSQRS